MNCDPRLTPRTFPLFDSHRLLYRGDSLGGSNAITTVSKFVTCIDLSQALSRMQLAILALASARTVEVTDLKSIFNENEGRNEWNLTYKEKCIGLDSKAEAIVINS